IKPASDAKSDMEDAARQMKVAQSQTDQASVWLGDKGYWGSVLGALREAMIAVEDRKEKEHGTKNIGVWVERLAPIIPAGDLSSSMAPPPGICGNTNEAAPPPAGEFPRPRPGPPGFTPGGRGGRGGRGGGGNAPPPVSSSSAEIDCILLTCRGVNL